MVGQKLDPKILSKLENLYKDRQKNSIQARISQISKDKGVPRGAAAEFMARQRNGTVWSRLSEKDQRCFRESEITFKKSSDSKPIPSSFSEYDPFKLNLARFEVSPSLAKECSVKRPYSKEINHAILNLESFMRDKMGLDEDFYGRALVDEAKKDGIFGRKNGGEEQGLYFMYCSAFLWLRNGGFHKKSDASKDECFKMIMFVDYLIKLFDKLVDQKKTVSS